MKHRRVPIPIRLLSYAWPYKARVLLTCVALAGLTAFQLIGPKLVGYAIDTGVNVSKEGDVSVAHGSLHTLLVAAALITAAAAARGVFQFWQA